MRVAVVAEFYPRRRDPVLGVWAHRQALAAAQAGAEVSVFVLHRLVPPRADPRALWTLCASPPRAPRRPRGSLRALRLAAALALLRPLGRLRRAGAAARAAPQRAFDLVHAHYAVPAADAVLRAGVDLPLVVSVHGGDVLWTSSRVPGGREAVERGLSAARLVLANSAGTEALSREHGARATRVVHLGTDVPPAPGEPASEPLIATVAHLVARKRHADVLRSLAELPGVRYLIVGDGPERGRSSASRRSSASAGASSSPASSLPARRRSASPRRGAWRCPRRRRRSASPTSRPWRPGSRRSAAPASRVRWRSRAPAPGSSSSAARAGGAHRGAAAPHRRPRAPRDALGAAARETVLREFTWPLCGERTLAAYAEALS